MIYLVVRMTSRLFGIFGRACGAASATRRAPLGQDVQRCIFLLLEKVSRRFIKTVLAIFWQSLKKIDRFVRPPYVHDEIAFDESSDSTNVDTGHVNEGHFLQVRDATTPKDVPQPNM